MRWIVRGYLDYLDNHEKRAALYREVVVESDGDLSYEEVAQQALAQLGVASTDVPHAVYWSDGSRIDGPFKGNRRIRTAA